MNSWKSHSNRHKYHLGLLFMQMYYPQIPLKSIMAD